MTDGTRVHEVRTGTKTGMRAGTEALKWIKMEKRPEGRESPGTLSVVVEVAQKTREYE